MLSVLNTLLDMKYSALAGLLIKFNRVLEVFIVIMKVTITSFNPGPWR